eukprot:TRINITY_DN1762_c0_g1_i6.p1 TRINITY_DN1762_c0_g1~~TRINITY_DN1762_c0_g1_i6.p1  ORF type:complete len:281 (+),score=50.17 TRINITY_DN1762_c0_g1_i6:187-1029(+)
METDIDNIEMKINEMIDKLIFTLNERRKYLLEYLKVKREKLRANNRDEEVEETLLETREKLVAQKFPNKLQSLHKRMLIEVDNKISDYLQPAQEIKFNGDTRDLETQIATLGEITLHELPILPHVPQPAATPDVTSKPEIDDIESFRRTNSPFRSPKPSPRHQRYDSKSHPREDTKQYLWGMMSRGDCETLLLQRAKQGEFIFRESPNREGELVLSMRYNYRIHHFNIKQEDGWFCIGENFRVRSLPEIISHFKKTPIASYKEHSDKLIDVFLSQALEKN